MEFRTVEQADRTLAASGAGCRMVVLWLVAGGGAAAVAGAYDVVEVLEEANDDDEFDNYYASDSPLDNCCMDYSPYCVWLV